MVGLLFHLHPQKVKKKHKCHIYGIQCLLLTSAITLAETMPHFAHTSFDSVDQLHHSSCLVSHLLFCSGTARRCALGSSGFDPLLCQYFGRPEACTLFATALSKLCAKPHLQVVGSRRARLLSRFWPATNSCFKIANGSWSCPWYQCNEWVMMLCLCAFYLAAAFAVYPFMRLARLSDSKKAHHQGARCTNRPQTHS